MISEKDISAFFADRKDLKADDYVFLTYRFETAIDPRVAVANLCCEQSTAQWARPGKNEDFRPLHGAKAVSLTPGPSPARGEGSTYEVEIAHPHRNFGPRIPNFLSAAAGEGPFYCPGISIIKWIDFEFPKCFLSKFEGPRFGLEGVRGLLGVRDRPIFLGVVKPNIGLTPQDFADIAYESWIGGLDIAKDDEMLADIDWSPLAVRAKLCAEAMKRAEEKTGERKIFVSNVTDEVDVIPRLHDTVVMEGVNMVMVNAVMTGFSAVRALSRHAAVPVLSHFTGMAVLSRLPNYGISSLVQIKLQRLAGGDVIVMPGFGDRMSSSDDEVLANVKACLEPWGNIKTALPVPGGSDSAETLPLVYSKIGHAEFGFICGRGVYGHPEGPAAGAKSLHDAWNKIRPR